MRFLALCFGLDVTKDVGASGQDLARAGGVYDWFACGAVTDAWPIQSCDQSLRAGYSPSTLQCAGQRADLLQEQGQGVGGKPLVLREMPGRVQA